MNSNVKFFADDTSLFSVVHNITASANLLNSDLSKINTWALQWKMSFNPDPTIQAQETIFSRKNLQRDHPGLIFNNSIVNVTTIHKHLGMIFDSKLSFDEHLKSESKKISKTVGLLQKFNYKSFARPYLHYGETIDDQTFNESFHQRIESTQYNGSFHKIFKNKSPSYLYNSILDRVKFYFTRSSQIDNISNIKTWNNFFRNSFFLLQ